MTEIPEALAPLRNAVFRAFWSANLIATLGVLVQAVGAAWLMATISRSADMVTMVPAAAAAPIVMFSVVSGAIADSFDRRKVMLAAQIFLLVTSLALVGVAVAGLLTPWSLLAFTFLLGCGTSLHTPSWQSSFADIVPKADLPAAVALNGMGFNITRGIGPAAGGAIIAAFGVLAAFVVNAVSSLALITVLWRWKRPVPTSSLPRESLAPAVGAGLRYVAMSPNLQAILLRAFVFGLCVIPVLALLPIVARDQLGGGALLYGMLFGAFGIGGVGGALLSGKLRRQLSIEWLVRAAFAGFAICAVILASSPWAVLAAAALLIGGAWWVIALTTFNIGVQLSTPRWVVGRALSLYHTASFGGQALGAWMWGVVAERLGTPATFAIAAVAMLAGIVLGFGRLALPALSSPNLDLSERWQEPAAKLDIVARSGPIKIVIEYLIEEDDITAFLHAMAERKRTRRRDGARRWSLTRDVVDPQIWMETYHFPTWADYVRCNQRVTHTDADIADRIRGLHGGNEPPRVHRMIERPISWHGDDRAAGALAELH